MMVSMKNTTVNRRYSLVILICLLISSLELYSQQRQELVVIDRGIDGYEDIVKSIDRNMTILLLGTECDQLRSLTDELKKYSGLQALHLFVHGEDAVLMFDHAAIHSGNIDELEPMLSQWKNSFREGADLLIYSCDLAKSCAGRELVHRIAKSTGLNVAASNDLTGCDKLNGNWVLEYTDGEIETTRCFNPLQIMKYHHTLKTAMTGN